MFRAVKRIAKVAAVGTAVGTTAYGIDRYFFYSTGARNAYTLYTGLIITLDYKWNGDNVERINELHERVAKRIMDVCLSNKGLYIKFGQQIASVPVLPPPYSQHLGQLFDKAPYVDYATVRRMFQEDFKQDPLDLFEEFDEIPIQSASIAQVHKARLKSGDVVAVKVQKPEIQHQLIFDLLTYRLLIFGLEKVFDLPLYWTADYIESHLKLEVDFLNEAENSRRCMRHIQEDSYLKNWIYVPKVFSNLTSKRIMTAEWIDGLSLQKLAQERDSSGFSKKDVMTKIVRVFSDQIFRSGFVHADPHVGNIIVRQHPEKKKGEAQVVIIDHGLYVIQTPKFTSDYANFWDSLLTLDIKKTEEIARSWGINEPGLFATATLARPWKQGKSLKEKPSMKDLYKSQVEAKAKVKKFLSDADRLPKELIFVGRNLNCLRHDNKILGSPVNRIEMMAKEAQKAVYNSQSFWERFKTYTGVTIVSTITNFWNWDNPFKGGASAQFEQELEGNLKKEIEGQFPGMKVDLDVLET